MSADPRLCSPDNLPAGVHADDWFESVRLPRGRQALELCTACPVMVQCQAVALAEGIPYGIFGGMTAEQREQYWRQAGVKPDTFWRAIEANVAPLLQERRDGELSVRDRHLCPQCGLVMVHYPDAKRAGGYVTRCRPCTNKRRRSPSGYIARREARLAAMGNSQEDVA